MDLLRHHYLYSPQHHPYRLSSMRYGAVSPYQVLTIPRCTCECYCERNRVQFAESEVRSLTADGLEGRNSEMDELKNGTFQFFFSIKHNLFVQYRPNYHLGTTFYGGVMRLNTSGFLSIRCI